MNAAEQHGPTARCSQLGDIIQQWPVPNSVAHFDILTPHTFAFHSGHPRRGRVSPASHPLSFFYLHQTPNSSSTPPPPPPPRPHHASDTNPPRVGIAQCQDLGYPTYPEFGHRVCRSLPDRVLLAAERGWRDREGDQLDNALAVASNNGTLSVHDSRGKLVQTVPPPDGDLDHGKLHSVTFGMRSRHLLFGGSASVVHVWDRKDAKYLDTLEGHTGTISAISLNADETLIASSSLTGDILIHPKGIRHMPYSALIVPTEKSITSLEFSAFRRDLMAATGDDGSVRLWDVQASLNPVYTFDSAHTGPVRGGVAFSPYNRYLMASAGLDRRVQLWKAPLSSPVRFHSVPDPPFLPPLSIVKSLQTDEPLTALSFKSDGVTIAAGSSGGRIYVYDLRQSTSPTCRVTAHEGSGVSCLRFQVRL
ncbi:WD40-repeat-containing domain protein [Jimgerdemannia flammicorona]|uniref:WD40-repeat-containing domain protein n=1 Tax=Jimgerdemannia flammicorona TaxID=994334 RepID=A0A433Q4D6_9FUNG|nr:WD40-repeat-containing domain protein [Jimgerdemannia flammicorona]